MQNENHRLHKLLPAKKENCHCLGKINQYETIKCNTNYYKHSFMPFCLDHFQEKCNFNLKVVNSTYYILYHFTIILP